MTSSKKGQGCGDRDHVEERPRPRLQHADDGRHAHVLAALEGDDRAQHGEPQEQDRGELVRPDDRLVEDVAGQRCRRAGRRSRRRPAAPPGSRRAGRGLRSIRAAQWRPRAGGQLVSDVRVEVRDVRHGALHQLAGGFLEVGPSLVAELAFPLLVEARLRQRFAEGGPVDLDELSGPSPLSSWRSDSLSLAMSARSSTAERSNSRVTIILHVLRQLLAGALVAQDPVAVPDMAGEAAGSSGPRRAASSQ